MGENHDVNILKQSATNKIGLRSQLLLSNTWPQHDRSWNLFAFHELLENERRRNVHGLARIVPFAVAWGAFDNWVVVSHAGFLRRLRNAVDVTPERDNRLARSPGRNPRRWHLCDSLLYQEPVVAQDASHITGGFELLKTQLAKAKNLVNGLLCEFSQALDLSYSFLFQVVEPLALLSMDSERVCE